MNEPKIPISSMAKENNNSSSNNNQQTQTWSTWEELLLACAVKRHGFKNWDSVAMEVRAKTSLPHLLITAQNCEQKYRDLKRRFSITTKQQQQQGQDHVVEQEEETENSSKTGDKVDNIPWLEELRKVRVAELRREVQRYDVSILSLQLKVKRLEQDRERGLQANGSVEPKPDLENNSKGERSANEKNEPEKPTGKKSISGEESDRENRSVNESNSTGSDRKTGGGRAGVATEPGSVRVASGEPASVLKQPTGENSCSRGSGVSHSDELEDSETRLSGDLQSSASLGRKRNRKERRRRKEIFGGGGDDGIKGASVKSEPLLVFLEMIRAHQHSSLFERRLQSQESDDYKNLVRQHLDLQTIQTKLEQGSYSSCTLSLYRDLLLLFNNAIIFFPKSSLESLTAHELRNLTSNEMKKETQKSDSSQEPPAAPSPTITLQAKPELQRSDSLLARQKSSAPLIVCRKRSSVSMKPSSSSSFGQKAEQQHSDDKKPAPDQKPQAEQSLKEKEKPVTGTRSSRRSNNKNPTKANSNTNVTSNKKQTTNSGLKAGSADKQETPKADKKKTGSADKQETPKTDKKKTEALASDKKRSVVDFLKRIKKNSPVETPKKSSREGGEQKKNSGGKKDAGKERVLRSNGDKKKVKEETSPSKKNIGRPPKKGAEAATVVASGKRGRDGGGGSSGKEKQQRKRARR